MKAFGSSLLGIPIVGWLAAAGLAAWHFREEIVEAFESTMGWLKETANFLTTAKMLGELVGRVAQSTKVDNLLYASS